MTAHIKEIEEQEEIVPAHIESPCGDKDLDSTACTPPNELQIVDLYTVGSEEPNEFEISPLPEVPFIHGIAVNGPRGSVVRVRGVFDSGAMVNAMCSAIYDKIKHRLAPLRPSTRRLRMANGSIIPSVGRWVGDISLGSATVACSFEVFPSGGSWGFLVGKPMQRSFRAIHNHATDEVTIPQGSGHEVLVNEIHYKHAIDMLAFVGLGPTSDIKQQGIFGGVPIEPIYQLTEEREVIPNISQDNAAQTVHTLPTEVIATHEPVGEPSVPWTDIWTVENQGQHSDPDPGTPQPEVNLDADTSIFTRKSNAFATARVEAVVAAIHIGDNLSPEEKIIVQNLIEEYADCFALSMSEVYHVPGAVHKIDVPKDKIFNTKVHQRPLTPPQRTYYNGVLDQMLEAGVIIPIAADKVKCVSPTTLAQKAHQGGGLTRDELMHRVNDQCIAAGIAGEPNLPPRPTAEDSYEPPAGPPKWRVCQNFAELNKVTTVPLMLQGDIRIKQQNSADKDGALYSTSLLGFTPWKSTRTQDPTSHSMTSSKASSRTDECLSG